MAGNTLDLFPLTIFKESISLPPQEKAEIVAQILRTAEEPVPATSKAAGKAWTGDKFGHEFLFRHPLFANLSRIVGDTVREYVEVLGIDGDQVDFFFQRSWATVTQRAENIAAHSHVQSNISFAYYPLKPENSGDIQFSMREVPNEVAAHIFDGQKVTRGFVKNMSLQNAKSIDVDVKEDDIVIFPSKTLHATRPNESQSPRISISGDVTLMLKDSTGHEHMMPNFSNWRQF